MSKTKIDINSKIKVSSADGSNLGPIRIVVCSFILDAHEFEHKLTVCTNLFMSCYFRARFC